MRWTRIFSTSAGEVICLEKTKRTPIARQLLPIGDCSTSEGWQGVRKVVIAEVEAERQAAERTGDDLLQAWRFVIA